MTGGGNGRTGHPVDASRRDAHTNNLSATIESLRVDFVAEQQIARRDRQQAADACADDRNAVSTSIGSFADEHATKKKRWRRIRTSHRVSGLVQRRS